MIKLTKKDNGATVEETISNLHHKATPQVFCRSSNLLVVDTGTYGHNPYRYVKINGKFGLLTAQRNHQSPHADSDYWWYNRDPSRNGEFMFWASGSETDSNKIFLYWSDLDNLPEVEYGLRDDCALVARGITDSVIKLHIENCGMGLRMWKCHGNEITISGDTMGEGLRMEYSNDNIIHNAHLSHMGRRGIAISHESHDNVVNKYVFYNSGQNESIDGSLFFTNKAHNNKCFSIVGHGATLGRLWPVDGGGLTFGERARDNVVVDAIFSDIWNAVSDNSGHPGNRVINLTAINCVNTFDQSDFNASATGNDGQDRFEGHGMSDPIDMVLNTVTCINSGPYGVRTPTLEMVKNLRVLGDVPPQKSRWEYPYYPDLPEYEGWNPITDAVNLQGPLPKRVVDAFK